MPLARLSTSRTSELDSGSPAATGCPRTLHGVEHDLSSSPIPTSDAPSDRVAEHTFRFLALGLNHGRRALHQAWRSLTRTEPALPTALAAATPGELPDVVERLEQALPTPAADWRALAHACRERGIRVLAGAQLPHRLRQIPDPPLALCCRGPVEALTRRAVAVVGARRCSPQGRQIAHELGRGLARHGFVVVSGLALGVDAKAHEGALQWGTLLGGTTVAVLGGGLLRVSPRTHTALADAVVHAGGCLVSEYALHGESYAANFPERNRLISGLALAVVVVEAGLRSGSLITARLALEQGRDVMAVPGSVLSPVSAGCHRLLREGAALVTNVQDVLRGLDVELETPAPPLPVAEHSSEAQLFRALARLAASGDAQSVEALQQASQLPAQQVLQALTRLELAGFVQRLPEGYIPSPR